MGTYHAHLTLCRLAAIAISKHLWMNTELRDSLKPCSGDDLLYHGEYIDIIRRYRDRCLEHPECNQHRALIVRRVVDNFTVPEPIKEELVAVLGDMGTEMLRTFHELQGILLTENIETIYIIEASAFVQYISWRADGSPDRSEIVRSLYFAGLFQSNYAAWEAVSLYCLEDCINDLWPKMGSIDEYRSWKLRDRWGGPDEEGFFSNYWIVRMENNLQAMIDFLRRSPETFYDDKYSIEGNMFINSVFDPRYSAVQYFWESLDENERIRAIAEICEEIRSDYPRTGGDNFFSMDLDMDLERINHSLMFLLHQLSYYGFDEIRIKLLRPGYVLRKILFFPYEGFFMDTLREMSTHHDFIDYGPILDSIFWEMERCKEFLFIDQEVKYRRIFYWIWNANLSNWKSFINLNGILYSLLLSQDFKFMNYILRDEELKDRREEILKQLANHIDRLTRNLPYYSDSFSKLLITEEEREWFKGRMAIPE